MAGGKKKSATQKAKGKYSKYEASGKREKNKAARIVKNLLKAEKPGVAAGKVIAEYEKVCNHTKADNVVANVQRALSKKNVQIVVPKKKEDKNEE